MASKKGTRSGGKFTGSHTTVIPAAGTLVDIAHKEGEVKKIALGFIKSGIRSAGGNKRVKMVRRAGNIHLTIRDNISVQEVVVYTDAPKQTQQKLLERAKQEGFAVAVK